MATARKFTFVKLAALLAIIGLLLPLAAEGEEPTYSCVATTSGAVKNCEHELKKGDSFALDCTTDEQAITVFHPAGLDGTGGNFKVCWTEGETAATGDLSACKVDTLPSKVFTVNASTAKKPMITYEGGAEKTGGFVQGKCVDNAANPSKGATFKLTVKKDPAAEGGPGGGASGSPPGFGVSAALGTIVGLCGATMLGFLSF